jgi:MoxR-like ATPase
MQERQVTVDLETLALPRPFLLIATQNPIELEGTFPLPEAQLDRFLLRLKIGYPREDEEAVILSRFQKENPLDTLSSVIAIPELLEIQKACREIYIEDSVRNYIVSITRASRTHPDVKLGASPRASLGLNIASQALAAVRGRGFVVPDDVKYLAAPALSHRLIARTEARLRGRTPEDIIKEIISSLPVPVEETK